MKNCTDNISLKVTSDCTLYNREQWYELECTIEATIKIPPASHTYKHMEAHRAGLAVEIFAILSCTNFICPCTIQTGGSSMGME
jgi:hypothetical protein